MLFKSPGIVFRSTKYSETSLILDTFSRENGLLSLIISGVRKSSSKTNAGIFRPLNIIDFVAYNKSGDSLSRIKEAKLYYRFANIGFDTIKSSIGLFIIDVARHAIKEKKDPNPELFDFLFNWIKFLDTYSGNIANLHLVFLAAFVQELGFKIQNNFDRTHSYFDLVNGSFNIIQKDTMSLNLELSNYLFQILNTSQENFSELYIPKKQRNSLLDAMLDFYKYHIDGFGTIKSLEVFRTVLS